MLEVGASDNKRLPGEQFPGDEPSDDFTGERLGTDFVFMWMWNEYLECRTTSLTSPMEEDAPLDLSLKEYPPENKFGNVKTESPSDPQVLGTGKENTHSKLHDTYKGCSPSLHYKKDLLERANRQYDGIRRGTSSVNNCLLNNVESYMDVPRSPSKGQRRTPLNSVAARSPMKNVDSQMDLQRSPSKRHRRTPLKTARPATVGTPQKNAEWQFNVFSSPSKGHRRAPWSNVLDDTRSPLKDKTNEALLAGSSRPRSVPTASGSVRGPSSFLIEDLLRNSPPRNARAERKIPEYIPTCPKIGEEAQCGIQGPSAACSGAHSRQSTLPGTEPTIGPDRTQDLKSTAESSPASFSGASTPVRFDGPELSSTQSDTAEWISSVSVPAAQSVHQYHLSFNNYVMVTPSAGRDARSSEYVDRGMVTPASRSSVTNFSSGSLAPYSPGELGYLSPASISRNHHQNHIYGHHYSNPHRSHIPPLPPLPSAATIPQQHPATVTPASPLMFYPHPISSAVSSSHTPPLQHAPATHLPYATGITTTGIPAGIAGGAAAQWPLNLTPPKHYYPISPPIIISGAATNTTASQRSRQWSGSSSSSNKRPAGPVTALTAESTAATFRNNFHREGVPSPKIPRWQDGVLSASSNADDGQSSLQSPSPALLLPQKSFDNSATDFKPGGTIATAVGGASRSDSVCSDGNRAQIAASGAVRKNSGCSDGNGEQTVASGAVSNNSGYLDGNIDLTAASGAGKTNRGCSDGGAGKKKKARGAGAGKKRARDGSGSKGPQTEGGPPFEMSPEGAKSVMQGLCSHMMALHKAKTNEDLVLTLAPEVHAMLQRVESQRPGGTVLLINEGFALSDPDWDDPMAAVKMHQTVVDGKLEHCWYDDKGALQSKPSMREASRAVRRSHGRYVCIFCTKRFADATDMVRHTRTHTKVKPFVCDMCNTSYSQQVTLEQHCVKHHGCNPQDKGAKRLKVHTCELCGLLFRGQDNYINHLKCQHPSHTHLRRLADKRLFEHAVEKKKTRKTSSGKERPKSVSPKSERARPITEAASGITGSANGGADSSPASVSSVPLGGERRNPDLSVVEFDTSDRAAKMRLAEHEGLSDASVRMTEANPIKTKSGKAAKRSNRK